MRSLRPLAVATAFWLSACASAGEPRGEGEQIRAVATIGMIADAVDSIGGGRLLVQSLMGAGVDPHLYKARAGDVRKLANAHIIFYNGLHLEAAMSEVLEEMDAWTPTVAVSEGIDANRLHSPPEYGGNYDPHIWFDVTLWMEAAARIRDALIELDPAGAEVYRAGAVRYLERLAELDAWVRQRVGELPGERRVLVTAHDAFGYFGAAYGFEVRGLQGINTAAEAGTADVQRLAEEIARRRIPAIFVESSIPQRTIEAVRAAVRSRGFDVEIGGQLFSDAMGDAGTVEGTYIGMVRHNVNTIVNALTAPGIVVEAGR
jgi:manganese/zinc/iron transport system substrate-binding protein